jgi:serine/threonine-protein kinase RsbT
MNGVLPIDPPTRDVTDAVLGVLGRYVSPTIAQSVLSVARQRAGVAGSRITRDHVAGMLDAIERSLAFFLGDTAQVQICRRALEELTSPPSVSPVSPRALTIRIRVEDDVARARAEARTLAAIHGFSTVGQTRLMTAVSELARNIVQYAGEGQIEIYPVLQPAGVEIVASDRGPGIENLDRIMAGDHRSRFGMGLGLLGVKKLAAHFDVRTEPGRGTTVTARMRVV